MESCYSDYKYLYLISDILENKSFLEIEKCKHHGISRLDHSMRVSYYSYLIAKRLGFNYKEVARAGLLHDFFINDSSKERTSGVSFMFHPYRSLENATNNFSLSDLEKDIIISHMFPALPHRVPKYIESWLVNIVDDMVAIYEFYCSYGRSVVYKFANVYLALLLIR